VIRVVRSTVIDAPVSAVWTILRDFSGHDRWHPLIRHSAPEASRCADQVGCVRRFKLRDGAGLRERLLALSDRDHRLRYAIVEADLPLRDYVAEIELKPVTDGDRTFWRWTSTFGAPPGQERQWSDVVGSEVYEAGFEAVRARVERLAGDSSPPPESGRAPGSGPRAAAAAAGALDGFAVGIDRHGGAEELRVQPVKALPPGPRQVRLRQTAVGVNFIDVYCRKGEFDLLTPPGIPGMEAAGVVIDVGAEVPHLSPGQRVAYACLPLGAYASVRTMDAEMVIALPDSVSDAVAAAGLLKGVTAEFLLHDVHPVQPDDVVVVHAAAGGVGQLLCQWASALGCQVIGVTSTPEKARVARACGAREVVLAGAGGWASTLNEMSGGAGATVIYDAVGRDSYEESVAALGDRGHLVSFGQASGDIGMRDIGALAAKSARISRPNYVHYAGTQEEFGARAKRWLAAVEDRRVKVEIGQRFALDRAVDAHRALESRSTFGATILVP